MRSFGEDRFHLLLYKRPWLVHYVLLCSGHLHTDSKEVTQYNRLKILVSLYWSCVQESKILDKTVDKLFNLFYPLLQISRSVDFAL
jgi:hypothetical protein